MNILVVNTVPTEPNGITNVIFNYLESFYRLDSNIGYVSINQISIDFEDRLQSKNIALYVLHRSIAYSFNYVYRLSKIARKYDIIHVHGNSSTMVLEMLAAKLAGIELRVAHAHSTSCNLKFLDKLIRPFFYLLCNGRIACGEESGKWLFRNREFIQLKNGIRTDDLVFNPTIRKIFNEKYEIGSCKVIGHLGNFDSVKNHGFILDVFRELLIRDSSYRLLLVGGGANQEKYESLAQKYGIRDKVIFSGLVNRPQDYLNLMDVVLMPSFYEGFPLSLVEEQANGLCCVISDTITKEVNLSGNVQFISLKASKDIWIQNIISFSSIDNRMKRSIQAVKLIKEKGFDINQQSQLLINYYKKHLYG